MFRNLLPLIILLFVSSNTFAQGIILPKPVKMFMKKKLPTQKSSSVAYRLIAETNLTDEGTGFDFTDSTTYIYKISTNNDVDSSYTYQWMGTSWEPATLNVNLYDSNGNPIGVNGYYYAGPGYVQDSRTAMTYDAGGNLLSIVYEQHDGTGWDTTLKMLNSYTNNLIVEEAIYQDQGSGLEPVVKTLTTYNAEDLPATVESQIFIGGWVGMDRVTYTYNSAGMVLTMTTETGNFMGGFENSAKETNMYDNRNHLAQHLKQQWNGLTWDNVKQTYYTVGTNGLVQDWLIEVWDGSAWQESEQMEYLYTGTRLDSTIAQEKSSGNWLNLASTSYSYDANGNQTLQEDYDWSSSAWVKMMERRQYYQEGGPTGIGQQPAKLEGLSVYPNPVQHIATFSFTAEQDSTAALAIYDLAGRQLLAIGTQATAGHNVMHWDASALPAGSYIYKINVGGKVATGVLVK